MNGVEIRGLELLNEAEKNELNKELANYSEKLKWKTKSDFKLKLVIKINSKKSEDKDSKRRRYSVQAMLKGETHSFEASVEDWDFNKVCHMIFDKLMNEVEHKYHSSEQHK